MIAIQQAHHYKQAKQRHLDRLSTLVWALTGQTDLFTTAMRTALFGIWQRAEEINLAQEDEGLFDIAIDSCRQIWAPYQSETQHPHLSKQQSIRYQVTQLPNDKARLILRHYMKSQQCKACG